MKLKHLLLFALGLSATLTAYATPNTGFRIVPPSGWPIFDTSTPGEWASSNSTSEVLSSGGSALPHPVSLDRDGTVVFQLAESQIANAIEHIQPEYYIGDMIEAPTNVHWTETFALLTNSTAYTNNEMFYEPSVPGLFLSKGGAITVDWVVQEDGLLSTNSHTYEVSGASRDKPYRIYWTDEPYNGPQINLAGKFVKFYGEQEILAVETTTTTNIVGGMIQTTDQVVKGLYLDTSTHFLQALGGIEGRVVMAYYTTGHFSEYLGSIVVEVCGPDVTTVQASIGDQLKPIGDGYNPNGLTALVKAGFTAQDDIGPYLYQHKGQHDYSPKNDAVYAVRKTVGEPWKIEIYWEQLDLMDTSWPFEVLQYECDWPDDAERYVRGDVDDEDGMKILIPDHYTPFLQEFQEPAGHATLTEKTFSSSGSGYSLLRLKGTDNNGEDNIWFIPVHSIPRTEALLSDIPLDWPVGTELRPSLDPSISEDLNTYHGYIYIPVSDSNYNTNLYVSPDLLGTNAIVGTTDPADEETYIFGVNKSTDKPLEVWWSNAEQQDGMPDEVWFPASAQQYNLHWPRGSDEVAEIILCSQIGSRSTSSIEQGLALDLSSQTNANMVIPSMGLLDSDVFTIECWFKPYTSANRYRQIFEVGNGASNATLRLALNNGSQDELHLTNNGVDLVQYQNNGDADLNKWTYRAYVYSNQTLTVYIDDASPMTSNLTESLLLDLNDIHLGASDQYPEAFNGAIDGFRIWNRALSDEEISAAKCSTLTGREAGLLLCFEFDSDDVDGNETARFAYDSASHLTATIHHGDWLAPGSPENFSGIISTYDNELPIIYAQNDASEAGYNPNEEHAFIEAESGGYVAYALRCDLNQTNETNYSSDPYVLVQYLDPLNEGRPNMQVFEVLPTNEHYTAFAAEMTAGTTVPGPHPLDYLANPWMLETYWETDGYSGTYSGITPCPGYRDRKGQVWAKNAGASTNSAPLRMHNYYPMQEAFNFPALEDQPEVGTPIPWLACLPGLTPSPCTQDQAADISSEPICWTWTVEWPSLAAELDIGETLTTASDNLPEIWNALSISVINQPVDGAVELYDPTVAQSAELSFSGNFMSTFGFDYADNAYQRNGYTYFHGEPPNVSGRFFYDPTAATTNCLKLEGELVADEGGLSYLQLNVLNSDERVTLQNLVSTNNADYSDWEDALNSLALTRVATDTDVTYTRSEAFPDSPYASSGTESFRVRDSIPADHYALTHMGLTNGFVTLIENDARDPDCGVDSGDSVNMHIFSLTDQLYAPSILPEEDPNNLLSEKLTILSTESFAGKGDNFEFEWRYSEPRDDGTTPTNYLEYTEYKTEAGLTRFTIGNEGDTLENMVNRFFVMRYKAVEGTPAYDLTNGAWSDWCGPTLAEGWVERCLNNITPFTQRMQDLYDNPTETTVSMIQQAGAPYEGDVTLNQDNLDNIGLIQLYQTILNKAESMSLSLGINNTAANQQLMLAATRLNDLYMLLGNEAYADAMDPTISFGSEFRDTSGQLFNSIDYGSLHSSLFCFDNLVPSLRDEELALLRGRSADLDPSDQTSPVFNRLYWNFTKGITAGEVAYAQNYQIFGNDVIIDEPQAAALYPMGHGDAWGHYLSALYGYYRLMRNPYFSWGQPSITPLMVGDAVVDADYYDEEKFAEAAAAMARTGSQIAQRTAEKAYLENDGTPLAGYRDEDPDRAFGYGEWGARAGMAALYNWAAANSLLPEETTSTNYTDEGVLRIDRSSVGSIIEVADAMKAAQQAVDLADAGMTPIGLAAGAIPFDLDPQELENGKSHFEQILERAEAALANATVLLDRAQGISKLQRQQGQTAINMQQNLIEAEASLNTQLIGIFGFPYEGDIGAGGTYAQDYSGPDIYHYMWMDLEKYGLSDFDLSSVTTITYEVHTDKLESLATNTVSYQLSSAGIILKPEDISGSRRAQGRLQTAYGSFIEAYRAFNKARFNYNESLEILESEQNWLLARAATIGSLTAATETYQLVKGIIEAAKLTSDQIYYTSELTEELIEDETDGDIEMIPMNTIAGLADGGDLTAPARGIIQEAVTASLTSIKVTQNVEETAKSFLVKSATMAGVALETAKDLANLAFEEHEITFKIEQYLRNLNTANLDLEMAFTKLINAQEAFIAIQADGERLLAERERQRKQAVNRIAAGRYQDMAFRIFHNEALSNYSNAFDLAQKYTYLAAKAYDYETALDLDSVYDPSSIYREIIGCRTIGHMENGEAQLGGIHGDGGLADVLARLKANWIVLEPRLGINNAQTERNWVSLRTELFRIKPSGTDGAQAWQSTLEQFWVDNLLDHPDFRRYCLPFNNDEGLEGAEPGLVIPFSTTIDFSENLFGNPLASGDHAFDSSHYATRIKRIGVMFTGYNLLIDDQDTPALGTEPRVYLIPIGTDTMRTPSSDGGQTLLYDVVDQVISPPFPLSGENLEDKDWTALYDMTQGDAESLATIRRYPSLRAYHDQETFEDDMISSTRLVGRSVWNTRWLLIIPAGTLHSDREYGLETFIKGADINNDGTWDQIGVQDIEIGFETYSTSGN